MERVEFSRHSGKSECEDKSFTCMPTMNACVGLELKMREPKVLLLLPRDPVTFLVHSEKKNIANMP